MFDAKATLHDRIQAELILTLFRQTPAAIAGHSIASTVLLLLMRAGTSYTCLTIHKVLKRSLQLGFENVELRQEAERSNAAKTQFLAAASHDLRQPIHALGLFFCALSERIRNAETGPLVAQIEATIGVIASMLDALLDISKLDAGVIRPSVDNVPLGELYERLYSEFQATARERRLDLRVRSLAPGLQVRTDPAMLERILRNLLSNALRYTQRGGVLLAARRRGGEVSCEVWDTGIGIAAEHLDDVFLEFRQLTNPQRDRP